MHTLILYTYRIRTVHTFMHTHTIYIDVHSGFWWIPFNQLLIRAAQKCRPLSAACSVMAPLRPTQSLRPNHVCFNNKRNAEGWAIVFNFPNRLHKLLCSSISLIFSQYRVIEGNDEIVMHCVKSQLQGEHVAGSPTTCCGSMTGCVVSPAFNEAQLLPELEESRSSSFAIGVVSGWWDARVRELLHVATACWWSVWCAWGGMKLRCMTREKWIDLDNLWKLLELCQAQVAFRSLVCVRRNKNCRAKKLQYRFEIGREDVSDGKWRPVKWRVALGHTLVCRKHRH